MTVARAARKGSKRPGVARRMARSTVRVGMLATAVLVGRKTAGGGRSKNGQGDQSGGSGGRVAGQVEPAVALRHAAP